MSIIDVLEMAARWHCLPSEVLEQPADPYLHRLADIWGVTPERVLEESELWCARQRYYDKMKARLL